MAAHEPRERRVGKARTGEGIDHRALGRADVAYDAVAPALQRLAGELGKRADGGAEEAEICLRERLLDRLAGLVDRTEVDSSAERLAVGLEAPNLGSFDPLARSEADRASDQTDAEEGDPQSADSSFPTMLATRWTCSTYAENSSAGTA
jgi:hypothetical protein